jgi:hypothetical protein
MNDYENMPDEQLVQLSLKDQDCFYYLMKRYEIKLLRYIKRLTSVSQEEAEHQSVRRKLKTSFRKYL